MFLFRRSGSASSSRLRAVRELYWSFTDRNSPDTRARRLLREWLSPAQLAQFDADGYFDVIGSETRRRYRIHEGTASNVFEIDEEGRATAGWCFVSMRPLARCDVMLAQKIALETGELNVLSFANKFPPRPHRRSRAP
jgi:hypothetical protein